MQDLVLISILSPNVHSFPPPRSKDKDNIAFERNLAQLFPVLGRRLVRRVPRIKSGWTGGPGNAHSVPLRSTLG